MRQDMAKVVTEAPRRGHANPSKKTGGRLHPTEYERDDQPTRLKVSRNGQYGWQGKEFSDVLGPLRKYLRKQVGRPWNTVYSELSATLDKRSLTGLHIWDHVKHEVTVDCWIDRTGQVRRRPRFGFDGEVRGLYVHPRTGVLCYRPARSYRSRPRVNADVRPVDESTELRRINGVWYECRLVTVTETTPASWRLFVWRGQETHHRHYVEAKTTTSRVVQRKRQLSRKELRHHGLQNQTISE